MNTQAHIFPPLPAEDSHLCIFCSSRMKESLHPRMSSEIYRNISRLLNKQPLYMASSSCLLFLHGSLSFSFFGLPFSSQLPETSHLLFKVLVLISAGGMKAHSCKCFDTHTSHKCLLNKTYLKSPIYRSFWVRE